MPRARCPEGLREAVFAAAGWRCARCGADRGGLTLSHRMPASKGGPWAPFNLDALCGSGTTGCHGWVEHHPDAAEMEGWRIRGAIIAKGGTVQYLGVDRERHRDWCDALERWLLTAPPRVW